uniref:Phosphatidic acid phosphatase type 2/haloperoxidase domain-containing protein n=1 Tax=Panagrolaimus sp. JU765 TaxID=591449 RepID=A0AC34Q9F3_9BILA
MIRVVRYPDQVGQAAVCGPNIDLDSCANYPIYITDYECTNPNHQEVEENRVSFFSGHSSYSMTTAVFIAFYLHARLSKAIYSHTTIPMLQFALIASASFIGWSRWVDHNHHWSDVFIGQIVGAVIGYLVVKHVAKMFRTTKVDSQL